MGLAIHQLKIFDSIVRRVIVLVVKNFVFWDKPATVAPPDYVVFVCIPAPITPSRIVFWRNN